MSPILVDIEAVGWGLAFAAAAFVLSIAVVTIMIVRMPADYFFRRPGQRLALHPTLRWTWLALRNLMGLVLVVAGIVMLATPGQGMLTILIGVALLSFPGKRALLRKLVVRTRAIRTMNRIRARFGKPPIATERPEAEQHGQSP